MYAKVHFVVPHLFKVDWMYIFRLALFLLIRLILLSDALCIYLYLSFQSVLGLFSSSIGCRLQPDLSHQEVFERCSLLHPHDGLLAPDVVTTVWDIFRRYDLDMDELMSHDEFLSFCRDAVLPNVLFPFQNLPLVFSLSFPSFSLSYSIFFLLSSRNMKIQGSDFDVSISFRKFFFHMN